jgi:hypothetical protein
MEALRPPRRRIFGRRRPPSYRRRGLFAVAAILVLGAIVALEAPVRSLTSCDIKGNVSRSASERIYHLPGQRYYDATRIDLLRGERWFCSEDEAIAAGWRRAKL